MVDQHVDDLAARAYDEEVRQQRHKGPVPGAAAPIADEPSGREDIGNDNYRGDEHGDYPLFHSVEMSKARILSMPASATVTTIADAAKDASVKLCSPL